jgi:hypothetical protein
MALPSNVAESIVSLLDSSADTATARRFVPAETVSETVAVAVLTEAGHAALFATLAI